MAIRRGNQKPRIDIYRDGDIELADRVIELAEAYGDKPLPWQRSVLRRWMAIDENGKWANDNCGLSLARQNGKTWCERWRIIGGMIFLDEKLVFTAQSTKTTEEIKRLVAKFFFESEPEIRGLLTAEFDKAPKSLDYLELRNGGRCVFSTRTRTAMLGTTNDTIIIDEAQEYTDAQEEAIRPTIASGPSGNSQIIMAGTPPTAGSAGTVFLRTRRNVLQGKGDGWCWQEWSVENITSNDDKDAWYETNPSLGYFLQEKAVANEAVTMAQDSFNKMRLGWHAGIDAKRIISDDEWNPLAVKKVPLPEKPQLCYAVKFAPDRSAVSLAVGVWIKDKVHVELVERKRMTDGTAWLTKWLLERYRKCNKIIIDGAAGTQLLIEDLIRSDRRISKKILTPNVKEAGAAYMGFIQAIDQKTLTHFDQPILNSAIRTAKRRDIGRDGMFGFAPLNPNIQCDPVDAVAFAHYASIRFKSSPNAFSEDEPQMLFFDY